MWEFEGRRVRGQDAKGRSCLLTLHYLSFSSTILLLIYRWSLDIGMVSIFPLSSNPASFSRTREPLGFIPVFSFSFLADTSLVYLAHHQYGFNGTDPNSVDYNNGDPHLPLRAMDK